MSGPPPRPAALKLLNGRNDHTDSGGRAVDDVPFKREPMGPPPEDLTEAEAAVWEQLSPELDRLEITKAADRPAFERLVKAIVRGREADEDISANGIVEYGAKGGRIKNPAVTVAEQASREIRMWAQEFGLTPSAENRISAAKMDPDGDSNPYAEGTDDNSGTG